MEYLRLAFVNSPWIMVGFCIRSLILVFVVYYAGKYMMLREIMGEIYIAYKAERASELIRYRFRFHLLLYAFWILTLGQAVLEYFKIIT